MTQIKVSLIDHMGSDLSVVNAARVSFGKQSEWVEGSEDDHHREEWGTGRHDGEIFYYKLSDHDQKLIRYLAKHKHMSPFGHAFASFHVKAPIFVARQLVKHKFLRWNEISRRYVTDEVELYYPEFWRAAADNVKQGSSNTTVQVNTYGSGLCVRCGDDVSRKSAGPIGKWCSEKCRSAFRKEHDPDSRIHVTKFNAQKRGLTFDLTRGDVQWVTHCPILGVELDYSVSGGKNPDYSPSIDRIDSSKGYVKDNVWVISNKANRMKNDGSSEELISFAKAILLHFNGQIVPEDGSVESSCKHLVQHYYHLLSEGVAPELARSVLPQNAMTEWYWSGSLDAFADMCRLRCASDTQYETRIVADQISAVMRELFPVSWPVLVGDE
jgi:thymidylate synthase ThyX